MAEARAAQDIALELRRVLQAGREMQAALARRLGLRVTDAQALDHVVSAPEPVGPGDLGHRLGMTSASATVLVDRLVAAGHLSRHADTADKRRVVLRATPHARSETRAALAPLLTDIAAITDQLDSGEAAVVLAFLGKVAATMRAYDGRS
ncbi:MarR family winged helix-turn-helix transcriptional regulator [Amycolatopsis minnesotensis]|uniref:MarR family winged helix-turn-helix transcriptional regulator n=1 Tax=Amycolatopsis minnesotensis TaxID=337894 RepID=A0ABN2SSN8_9PSEU